MRYLTLLLFTVPALLAGQDALRVSFEVASVKATSEPRSSNGMRSTGMAPRIDPHAMRVTFANVTLMGLLCRAYDLLPYRIHGPEWMNDHWYSIDAKAAAGAPEGHIPEMLQSLLAERFQMKLHWETREEAGYSLAVAKGGSKLKESAPDANRSAGFRGNGHLQYSAYTMGDFAAALNVLIDKAVLNATELPGTYDITIDAAPDSMPGFRMASGQDSTFPTIFAALRELGLSLAPARVPVKYLVVDSALKVPTEN
jgi:uncharacterized protein (TIGR03435 family)